MVEDSAKGFWRKRSTFVLRAWVMMHFLIFSALEVLGLFPVISHSIDFVTLVIGDEIVQLLLVAPAVKELWRRQFKKEIKENSYTPPSESRQ